MSRRRELRDDLATVRHQHAFAQAYLAKVFAKAIFELSDTDSFHSNQCSVMALHCQILHKPTEISTVKMLEASLNIGQMTVSDDR